MTTTRYSLVLMVVLTWIPALVAAQHGSPSGPLRSGSPFADIARRETAGVVSIVTWSPPDASRFDEDEEVLRLFERFPPAPGPHSRAAVGAGFVITTTGDILTNNHIVEGATRIEVSLFGDETKRYRAVVVGRDPSTDSAVIRLLNPPPNLRPATLGDSSTLAPGDWVMAIGHPFRLSHSVTVGVVSSQRPFEIQHGRLDDMIQTDLSMNPGSSGGPLFNMNGEVVGINVAVLGNELGGNLGVGFAVPINTVKALLPQLQRGDVVRGQLGVELHAGPILQDEATALGLPNALGAIVMAVEADTAAYRAGLRAGDVIVRIGGRPVTDTRDLIRSTAATAPGTRVAVKIFRHGKPQTRSVIIEQQPVDRRLPAPADDDAADDDGVTLGEVPPSGSSPSEAANGVVVLAVAPYSAADDAELAAGDIIQLINGRRVRSVDDARRELHRKPAGQPVFLLVSRRGAEVFLKMRRT